MAVEIRIGDALEQLRQMPPESVHCCVSSPLSGGQFKRGEHWRPAKPHWDLEWLHREYIGRERSAAEIATEMGCGENNILYWLKRHDIPRRSMAQIRATKRWGSHGRDNPMFGRTGPLNPRYVDGSSPERQRAYVQAHGKEFLRLILKRDGYRCRRCDSPKQGRRSLHVHHIKSWAGNPALRFDETNAVTLCRSCHNFVHSKKNIAQEYL